VSRPQPPAPKAEALRALEHIRGLLGRPLDGLELTLAQAALAHAVQCVTDIPVLTRVRRKAAPEEATS
jgi:hypothetical protein